MKELMTSKDELGEYINDITKEMDKHLIRPHKYFSSYIYNHQICKNHWTLRYPGATRGHILVDDDNVILDVRLYDTAIDPINSVGCYLPSVEETVKQFIGCKLVFKD